MLATRLRFGPRSHGRTVTHDELENAEYRPGYKYEVIFGRLYVSPAPNPQHDVVEKHIVRQLFLYQDEHPDLVGCVSYAARVFVPSDSAETAPEPDIAVCSEEPLEDWRDAEPFIVGEVMRSDSVDKDLFRNVGLYWSIPSIKEYWVFDIRKDAQRPVLLVYRRGKKRWDAQEYPAEAIYETSLLPGLKLKISPPCSAGRGETTTLQVVID